MQHRKNYPTNIIASVIAYLAWIASPWLFRGARVQRVYLPRVVPPVPETST